MIARTAGAARDVLHALRPLVPATDDLQHRTVADAADGRDNPRSSSARIVITDSQR
jgi:hypothetical protein